MFLRTAMNVSENRDLKETQKIKGKTCSSFSCTSNTTCHTSRQLRDLSRCMDTSEQQGQVPAQETTLTSSSVFAQMATPYQKDIQRQRPPLDSFCKPAAARSLLWLSGIAVSSGIRLSSGHGCKGTSCNSCPFQLLR